MDKDSMRNLNYSKNEFTQEVNANNLISFVNISEVFKASIKKKMIYSR